MARYYIPTNATGETREGHIRLTPTTTLEGLELSNVETYDSYDRALFATDIFTQRLFYVETQEHQQRKNRSSPDSFTVLTGIRVIKEVNLPLEATGPQHEAVRLFLMYLENWLFSQVAMAKDVEESIEPKELLELYSNAAEAKTFLDAQENVRRPFGMFHAKRHATEAFTSQFSDKPLAPRTSEAAFMVVTALMHNDVLDDAYWEALVAPWVRIVGDIPNLVMDAQLHPDTTGSVDTHTAPAPLDTERF